MPRGVMGAVEAASARSGGDELIVGDGERALIRILGDGGPDDGLFGVYAFHTAGNGEQFKDLGICRKDVGEPVCQACESNAQRRQQLAVWVWVDSILHAQQKMPDWEAVTVRGRPSMYKETVGKPKILRKGLGKGRAFLELFVNYYMEYGALNNRDYVFSRSGQGFDTTYSLVPRGDSSELTEQQTAAAISLPEIAEYYKQQAARSAPVALSSDPMSLDETPF